MYQIKVNRIILRLNGPTCNKAEYAELKDRFERTMYSDMYENVLEIAGLTEKEFSDEEEAEQAMNNLDEYFKIEWQRLEKSYPINFFKDCELENGASFYITKI